MGAFFPGIVYFKDDPLVAQWFISIFVTLIIALYETYRATYKKNDVLSIEISIGQADTIVVACECVYAISFYYQLKFDYSMTKKILIILFAVFIKINSLFAQSNNKISFTLEELDPPTALLETKTIDEIYSRLICSDYKTGVDEATEIDSKSEFIANSLGDKQIVGTYGYNPFLFGLREAYSHHRPVVLSPDVISLNNMSDRAHCQRISQNHNEISPMRSI